MTYFVTKTVLAFLFVAAGLTATLSMLTLMGRSEKRTSAGTLRTTHRVAGYTFAALLVVLGIMGLWHLSSAGDSLPVRGVLHWSVASLLVFVLALKLAIVRWFKQFLKFVPAMGMVVITLALVVAMLSAVFFIATGGMGGRARDVARQDDRRTSELVTPGSTQTVEPPPDARSQGANSIEPVPGEPKEDAETAKPMADAPRDRTDAAQPGLDALPEGTAGTALADAAQGDDSPGNPGRGAALYRTHCAGCHYSDSAQNKIGPGLGGLFAREKILSSGRSITPANVREHILAPAGSMPAFRGRLTDVQLDDLIAHLATL